MATIEERLAVLEKTVELECKAKVLQAVEYERRLENLNHEAERLRAMQATYLPREVAEALLKDICKRISDLEIHEANIEGKASQKDVNNTKVIAFIGIVIAIVGLILKFVS